MQVNFSATGSPSEAKSQIDTQSAEIQKAAPREAGDASNAVARIIGEYLDQLEADDSVSVSVQFSVGHCLPVREN